MNPCGIILTSANLTWAPVEITMAISAAVLFAATVAVAIATLRGR